LHRAVNWEPSDFALGLLFFVVIVLVYGIIAIHAAKRHHPHEDAIHAAGCKRPQLGPQESHHQFERGQCNDQRLPKPEISRAHPFQ
jgi:hypothetical protein